MYTIRFYLHPKAGADGARAIFYDVRWGRTESAVTGARLRGSTGKTVHPDDWNDEAGRVRARGIDYAKTNRKLAEWEARLGKALDAATSADEVLTPTALKAILKPPKAAPVEAPPLRTVRQVVEEWRQHYRLRYKSHTLRKPYGMLNHLEAWHPDCPIHLFTVDPKTRRCPAFESFCTYMVEDARVRNREGQDTGLDNNTTGTYIKALRSMLKFEGMPYDWMKDELSHLTEAEALEFEEVERLMELDLTGERDLMRARDVFVFACFTGPRYENLRAFTPANVVLNHDMRILEYSQFKGKIKSKVRVALDPMAAEIWDHYGGKLPVPANHSLNTRIKEVARRAGLDRLVQIIRVRGTERHDEIIPLYQAISAHTARHTFATLLLDGGANLTDVQDGLGHADIHVTRRYAKSRAGRRHLTTLGAFDKLREERAANGAHRAESVPIVPRSD